MDTLLTILMFPRSLRYGTEAARQSVLGRRYSLRLQLEDVDESEVAAHLHACLPCKGLLCTQELWSVIPLVGIYLFCKTHLSVPRRNEEGVRVFMGLS